MKHIKINIPDHKYEAFKAFLKTLDFLDLDESTLGVAKEEQAVYTKDHGLEEIEEQSMGDLLKELLTHMTLHKEKQTLQAATPELAKYKGALPKQDLSGLNDELDNLRGEWE